MKYAGIIYDDTAAAPGLCLSFYVQGCPIRCPGCHNIHTWDPDGGHEFTQEVLEHILKGLTANGVQRSLCILGGEPLAPYNLFLTNLLIDTVRKKYPELPIWIWTGYHFKTEIYDYRSNPHLRNILNTVTGMITEPFILEERDITLPMRGSSNQKIMLFDKEKKMWYNKENKEEVYYL